MFKNFEFQDLNPNDKPRERLVKLSTSALSDAELLAIILRSGGVENSVLHLASQILKHFNGLKGLINADIEQLTEFKNVGLAKATSIKAACEIGLRNSLLTQQEKPKLDEPQDIYEAVRKDFFAKDKEQLIMLSLDTRNNLIAKDVITIGLLNETLVHPREVYKQAFMKGAASIILVHNHPSQNPEPSTQDIRITERIAKAGICLGIPLVDHLIICDHSYLSMKMANHLKGGD